MGSLTFLDRLAERAKIGSLLDAARGGDSAVMVVSGTPGVGKTALLDHAVQSATGLRVARVSGVEPEIELAFAALQQLLAPMLHLAGRLPDPQRDALDVGLGQKAGPARPIPAALRRVAAPPAAPARRTRCAALRFPGI